MGRCQSCGAWNTIVEEVVVKETTREERSRLWKGNDSAGKEAEPIPLSEIQTGNTRRLPTPDAELNRVLGGGIVEGELVGRQRRQIDPLGVGRLTIDSRTAS